MAFDFIENFTLELPDFSKIQTIFSESFNDKHGLIIEVAAIHERVNGKLQQLFSSGIRKSPTVLGRALSKTNYFKS